MVWDTVRDIQREAERGTVDRGMERNTVMGYELQSKVSRVTSPQGSSQCHFLCFHVTVRVGCPHPALARTGMR